MMKQVGDLLRKYEFSYLAVNLLMQNGEEEKRLITIPYYYHLYKYFLEIAVNASSKLVFSHAEKNSRERYHKIWALEVKEAPFSLLLTAVNETKTCMNLWVPECVLDEYGEFVVLKAIFDTIQPPLNLNPAVMSDKEFDKVVKVLEDIKCVGSFPEFDEARHWKLSSHIIYECKQHFCSNFVKKSWKELLQYDEREIKKAACFLKYHIGPDPFRIERSYEAIKDRYERYLRGMNKQTEDMEGGCLVIEEHGEQGAPLLYVIEDDDEKMMLCDYAGELEDLFGRKIYMQRCKRSNEELMVWICMQFAYPIRMRAQKQRDLIQLLQRALKGVEKEW